MLTSFRNRAYGDTVYRANDSPMLFPRVLESNPEVSSKFRV